MPQKERTPKIERDRITPAGRRMNEHEAAAADIAGRGISHTQCEAHRDGGVHCVAAALQDGNPRIRREPGDAHRDALAAFN